MKIEDIEEDDTMLYVGIVCDTVDQNVTEIIEEALDDVSEEYVGTEEFEDIVILVYNMDLAKNVDFAEYKTIGFTHTEKDEITYDFDEMVYNSSVEEENQDFIDAIDVLVKIGDGKREQEIMKMAESEDISILEYDLDTFEE